MRECKCVCVSVSVCLCITCVCNVGSCFSVCVFVYAFMKIVHMVAVCCCGSDDGSDSIVVVEMMAVIVIVVAVVMVAQALCRGDVTLETIPIAPAQKSTNCRLYVICHALWHKKR